MKFLEEQEQEKHRRIQDKLAEQQASRDRQLKEEKERKRNAQRLALEEQLRLKERLRKESEDEVRMQMAKKTQEKEYL